jgi:DNA-binding SARP family transcriptional activator
LYLGDFLASSRPAWSDSTRDILRDRYQRALMAMGRLLLSGGAQIAAIDAFRRVTASEPLSEAAHRELMRCYEELGEPSRAVQQYENLVDLLSRELGTSPAVSTTNLYERIRAQWAVAGTQPA